MQRLIRGSQVAKAYSKNWSHREDALTSLHQQLQSGQSNNAKDDFKAAVFMCKRGINDPVFAVRFVLFV